MSRRGNCWDNAVAESFFSSLKKERIKKRIYKTRAIAKADEFQTGIAALTVHYTSMLRVAAVLSFPRVTLAA